MPSLGPRQPTLIQCRSFCKTAAAAAKSSKQRLQFEHSDVPPYPHGPSPIYKQSNFGLYGTQKIRFGNMVSERNKIKTRRFWRPNVHTKALFSASLGKNIQVRITTRVLRTVRKVGGLDEYLLGDSPARIRELGMGGWKLRWRIMQTPAVKERFRLQRVSLGLAPRETPPVNSEGQITTPQKVVEEMKMMDNQLNKGIEVNVGEEADLFIEGSRAQPVATVSQRSDAGPTNLEKLPTPN
ncbi:hypothetical protein K3495_g641 [Podosphaera aphanis]|nr:hypothetical protein K3495_g641 [Podosphaera aphanis]